MSIGPQSSQEVFERFTEDSIFKGKREDYLIFPDNHPTTWIIAFMHKGQFMVFAFYPKEANNYGFDDYEQFEMSAQAFIEHFGYDTCEEFFTKNKIEWEAWL